MSAVERHMQDRKPEAGGLTFPIKLRCRSISDLMAERGLEPALARALGRAFARARATLPAPVAVGGGVALQAPYLTGRDLAGDQAKTLLARVQRAIETAARAQALPEAPIDARSARSLDRRVKQSDAEKPSGPENAELFDPKRSDPRTGSYQIPSYQGGAAQVPARGRGGPFDHLLNLLGSGVELLDQFLKEQFTLSGIANKLRRQQWDEMKRALADLMVERKATQAVADVLAGKLDAAKVTGPDRQVADRVVRKYRRNGEQFPVRDIVARREAQQELGNVLLDVICGYVDELDRKAGEYADEVTRNTFLDVGSYYLELIGFPPHTVIERLAFLETFYSDIQVILVYAVLRFVRQELPELWDNLKLGTIFVLGDIGNTNMLSSYALGFAPGTSEAAQIVVINRALWI